MGSEMCIRDRYNKYCDIHEAYILADDEKNNDELELLEILIDVFENEESERKISKLNPVELLALIIEEENIKQVELAVQLGVSKSLVSDILAYKRGISKGMATKLSKCFSMSLEAFSRDYKLKKKHQQAPNL